MPRCPRTAVRGAFLASLVAASLSAVSPSSSGSTPPDVAAKPLPYAQPTKGEWAWDKHFSSDIAGGFNVKHGKSGKPPKVVKIHYKVVEENNGYYCPPEGQTLKVKGTFKLNKAKKYSSNPQTEVSPWTLSKKDAPPKDKYDHFGGIVPVETTVEWGGNSYPAQVAMYFWRDKPWRPYEARTYLSWRVDDPELPGGCGYDASAYPEK